jgi:hypothetical protein
MRPLFRTLLLSVCAGAALLNDGCYTYQIYQVGGPNGRELGNQPATEWQHKTLNAFAWGAVRQDLPITGARNVNNATGGIEEVKVETNAAYLLVSVATLGLWVPLEVSWRCAKPQPAPAGSLP